MAKTIAEERLRWVLPIVRKKIKLTDASRVCPYSKRSLERWVSAYRKHGEQGLVPQSTRPKSNPGETPIHIKEEVLELRKKTKLCAKKLHWKLGKKGVHIHERTVGKILKAENMVRKYRVKKVKYKYLKAERKPGELIEIDVKHVPGPIAGHKYYQYTAIDCASRWRLLKIYDQETNSHSLRFLAEVMSQFPYPIQAIKTDNHSTFTNYYTGTNKRSDMTVKTIHSLDRFCSKYGILHYLIDPGRPAQNGTVERSHREDQEKLYDQSKFTTIRGLRRRVKQWNMYYNNLEHCGLDGKTPNEILTEYQLTNPPEVCA